MLIKLFVIEMATSPNYASKLWAYLIPTPANLLIYGEFGYNLKVRDSNPLPANRAAVQMPIILTATCLVKNEIASTS